MSRLSAPPPDLLPQGEEGQGPGLGRRGWLLLGLAALAACGKKADLDAPPGTQSEFPRRYPR